MKLFETNQQKADVLESLEIVKSICNEVGRGKHLADLYDIMDEWIDNVKNSELFEETA
jgi:hypothetical protein